MVLDAYGFSVLAQEGEERLLQASWAAVSSLNGYS